MEKGSQNDITASISKELTIWSHMIISKIKIVIIVTRFVFYYVRKMINLLTKSVGPHKSNKYTSTH